MKDLFVKIGGLTLLVVVVIVVVYQIPFETSDDTEVEIGSTEYSEVVNGIHQPTGFIVAEGYELVVANCTGCHSAKIVTQNRMTKNQWNKTILWMQRTQNLWDLGENQEVIVNYLVTNYPITNTGRRANIAAIEWYELNK